LIFLTVGSHEPFDRLVIAVDDWCQKRKEKPHILGQITARAGYRPKGFAAVDNLSPAEFEAEFGRASLVVAHAGMGTILTALSRSKPIIVMPRRGHLGETRNDHQYATAIHLPKRAGLWIARDETELPDLLEKVLQSGGAAGPAIEPFAGGDLIDSLRNFIFRKN
jgi:UDP-N-acetylglucosamine transferase subunit ALG13